MFCRLLFRKPDDPEVLAFRDEIRDHPGLSRLMGFIYFGQAPFFLAKDAIVIEVEGRAAGLAILVQHPALCSISFWLDPELRGNAQCLEILKEVCRHLGRKSIARCGEPALLFVTTDFEAKLMRAIDTEDSFCDLGL